MKAEEERKTYPGARDHSDGFRGATEPERPAFEALRIEESHGDGDPVGDVEADRGNRDSTFKRDFGAKDWESEEEGADGAEDDGADR